MPMSGCFEVAESFRSCAMPTLVRSSILISHVLVVLGTQLCSVQMTKVQA